MTDEHVNMQGRPDLYPCLVIPCFAPLPLVWVPRHHLTFIIDLEAQFMVGSNFRFNHVSDDLGVYVTPTHNAKRLNLPLNDRANHLMNRLELVVQDAVPLFGTVILTSGHVPDDSNLPNGLSPKMGVLLARCASKWKWDLGNASLSGFPDADEFHRKH